MKKILMNLRKLKIFSLTYVKKTGALMCRLKCVCPIYPQVKVQPPAKQSFAYPLGQPVRAAAKYPARPEFYPVKVLPDRHM